MLREAAPGAAPITGTSDVLGMKMHNDEFVFEPDRHIAWEPEIRSIASCKPLPDDRRAGHVWGFKLAPDGPNATVVTEYFDCSRAPAWLQAATKGGETWRDSINASLERIDSLCRADRR